MFTALIWLLSGTVWAGNLECPLLYEIEKVYLAQHVAYNEFTPVLETRTVDQYIKRIDGMKVYLLKSDVALIHKKMANVFNQIKERKCQVLNDVQEIVVKRVEERTNQVREILQDKKFQFDPKTELIFDPDKRDFATTSEELKTFLKKYLMFQLSNYLATDVELSEARENVIKNFERSLKRVKETKQEDLFANYLDTFGRSLDPHSSYLSADNLEDFEIQMGLSLEGIGASLSSQDGYTVVEQLMEGGSAKASGLVQPQDKILAVGQVNAKGEPQEMENVFDMDLRDVVKKIRGPKGTKVRLMLLRKTPEGKEKFTIELVRDKINLENDAAQITYVDREIGGKKIKFGVLNLPAFYNDNKRGGRSSSGDMKKVIKEAREQGIGGLVLDLSQNLGGSLDDAVKIAGLFFKTGNVVKQSGKDKPSLISRIVPGSEEIVLADTDAQVDWAGPTVILTSRNSASASEIVSGTLKDYKRAVIVGGDHTFGKGSVQSVVQLPTGMGAVKVTVGMFFTAGGYSTQHRGVSADIVLPGVFSTDEFGEKTLEYSLPPRKVAPFLSKEAYVTEGDGAWSKIEAPLLDKLRAASKKRVAASSEFKKIKADMAKLAEKSKVIKLGETLKKAKEHREESEQKKKLDKEGLNAEYLKRPDIQESVNVLADLVASQSAK